MKFILINCFFIFGIFLSFSQDIEINSDSINIRKSFFNQRTDWDSYLNDKTYFENKQYALIVMNEVPYTLNQEIMNSDILSRITDPAVKDFILSIYDPVAFYETEYNEELDTSKRVRKFRYHLSPTHSYKDKIRFFNILKSIRFTKYDYLLIFYKINPELERKSPGFNLKNGLLETYTYGKFEYQIDYQKNLNDVKVFYQDNNNSYIHFNIRKPKSADLVLFGKIVSKDIPFYHPFDSLKTASLNSVLNLLTPVKKTDEALITKDDKKIKEDFIDKIIKPSLQFEYDPDGAINDTGDPVYIETLLPQKGKPAVNCSGFLKDVIDNYIRQRNPDFLWLKIEDLKKRRDSDRKDTSYLRYEFKLDPFFGLDWVKNLVDQVNYHCNYNNIRAHLYSEDPYSQYFEEKGYAFDALKEVLFRDQKKDFNYFYLVVFNRLRNERPMIPEYYHSAVIVPYFHQNHFFIRVFESGEETSFENLKKFQSKSKVVIFKIPMPRYF